MIERSRQGADNLEAEFLPQANARLVCRNDEVKLHGLISEPARFVQAMLSHGVANPLPSRIRRDHKTCVGHMGPEFWAIRPEGVSPNDPLIFVRDVGLRVGTKPVS